MTKVVALHSSGCPKFCVGCGRPFPVRNGRRDVQVGLDGRLYCHAMTPKCVVLAVKPVTLRRAA
jgi:hypothetical protein